jgi:succinate dehydrogenase / fumarate reductase membrane anchor subunit
MKASSNDLRSKLARAKGLGSAKSGVGHWWYQRLTAVALIPLSVWFVYSLVTALQEPSPAGVAMWLSSPVHTVAMLLMLIALFFHAKLGLQVVIEDYVKCPVQKYSLLFANNFLCIAFAIISILAVLKLHFLDVAAGA